MADTKQHSAHETNGTITSRRRKPAEVHELGPDSILRIDELQKYVPLGRTSIYRAVKAGKFPAPLKLSERTSGWLWGDVLEWRRNLEKAAIATNRGAA